MDKETEIQEATKIISDTVIKLFNAGYRKADEVRKETAKEILQSELDNMKELTGCGVPYHFKKFIKKLADKYGVEVEE